MKRYVIITLSSSYHHLVWLALIGNSSELSSFSTLSKLIMKPLPTAGMKTPAEIKQLAKFFTKPGCYELRSLGLDKRTTLVYE